MDQASVLRGQSLSWLARVRIPDGVHAGELVIDIEDEDYVRVRARRPRPDWPFGVQLAFAIVAGMRGIDVPEIA